MEDKNKISEIKNADQNDNVEVNLEDNTRLHVSALEEQLKEENNKYMLLYADFENYKTSIEKIV